MEVYWKLASLILPSSPRFTVQSAVQTPEAHNSPACCVLLPGSCKPLDYLMATGCPQPPFGSTHPEG